MSARGMFSRAGPGSGQIAASAEIAAFDCRCQEWELRLRDGGQCLHPNEQKSFFRDPEFVGAPWHMGRSALLEAAVFVRGFAAWMGLRVLGRVFGTD